MSSYVRRQKTINAEAKDWFCSKHPDTFLGFLCYNAVFCVKCFRERAVEATKRQFYGDQASAK